MVVWAALLLLALQAPSGALTSPPSINAQLQPMPAETGLGGHSALIEKESEGKEIVDDVADEYIIESPKTDEEKVAAVMLNAKRKRVITIKDIATVHKLLSKGKSQEVEDDENDQKKESRKPVKTVTDQQLRKAEHKILFGVPEPHPAERKEASTDRMLRKKTKSAMQDVIAKPPPDTKKHPNDAQLDKEMKVQRERHGKPLTVGVAHKYHTAKSNLYVMKPEPQEVYVKKLSDQMKLSAEDKSERQLIRGWIKNLFDSIDDGAGVVHSQTGLQGVQALARKRYIWSDNGVEEAVLSAQFASAAKLPRMRRPPWPRKEELPLRHDPEWLEARAQRRRKRSSAKQGRWENKFQKFMEEELEWQTQPYGEALDG